MANVSLIKNYIMYSVEVAFEDFDVMSHDERSAIRLAMRDLFPDIDSLEWESVPEYEGETHAHLYFRVPADLDTDDLRNRILTTVAAAIDEKKAGAGPNANP